MQFSNIANLKIGGLGAASRCQRHVIMLLNSRRQNTAVDDVFPSDKLHKRRDWVQRHAACVTLDLFAYSVL
jgi:hypothetical protein